jgi:S-adenosylmethionine synthetase
MKTLGFYEAIKTKLDEKKGSQINYDAIADILAIEITQEVLKVFKKRVDEVLHKTFDECKKAVRDSFEDYRAQKAFEENYLHDEGPDEDE